MKIRYIGTIDTPALIPGKVYDVLAVERGWYRVMTELDQDYLFPPQYFEVVK